MSSYDGLLPSMPYSQPSQSSQTVQNMQALLPYMQQVQHSIQQQYQPVTPPTVNMPSVDWSGQNAAIGGYYDQAAQAAAENYQNKMQNVSSLMGEELAKKARRQGVWGQGPQAEWGKTFSGKLSGDLQTGLSNIYAQAAAGKAGAYANNQTMQQAMQNWKNQYDMQNQYQAALQNYRNQMQMQLMANSYLPQLLNVAANQSYGQSANISGSPNFSGGGGGSIKPDKKEESDSYFQMYNNLHTNASPSSQAAPYNPYAAMGIA